MKKSLVALALAALLPLSAQATDLNYNWLEGNYSNLDHGTDGWGLRGQFGLGSSGLYGLGGYHWLRADDGLGGKLNIRLGELGLGYHYSVAAKTDLIGELAWQQADAAGISAHGMRGSFGLRSAMSDKFEGIAKVNYYDSGDYSGDVTGTIGAQYKFNPTWGLTGETEFGQGDQAWMLGVRASF